MTTATAATLYRAMNAARERSARADAQGDRAGAIIAHADAVRLLRQLMSAAR